MRYSFLTIFLLTACSLTFAQNNVSITQQGKGNTATISQSSNGAAIPCPEEFDKKMESGNKIMVKSGDKTILKQTDSKTNAFSGVLKTDDEIHAVQDGSLNLVSALLSGSKNSLMLSQQGTDNTISINPCNDGNPNTEAESNAVNIQQTGTGNSASISQQ